MSNSYEFSSWIGEDELAVWVVFDNQPAEEATSTYPGCSESITIGSVEVRNFYVKELLDCLNAKTLAKLEADCWDFLLDPTNWVH